MAKHALLSASGAHRWLLCTPSAQLEQKFPASTSAYAEEGTVAHALAELTTRYFLGELDEVSYENQIKSEFEPNSYPLPVAAIQKATSVTILPLSPPSIGMMFFRAGAKPKVIFTASLAALL